ncbi:trans-aconitate 2-methyltransferase [Anaeromyxobacter sp. PSR-1]|uniref:class I SAM-dependent methyltransferase n=1 Tax=unclassified Anaeromyxobacter TaxID=2620896 RepID=UPI0005E72051|nr:class I SAM-dependent methyltransferase [Anaeromyxobacter sp. PSR-1]GAO03238.1 tRNA (cmo5U34)-methyltransferase [Anaeromyxobacter sp. PSR-1]
MDVKQVFDGAAARYDALRRQLIPCFDGFYGAAVDLLPFEEGRPVRVLDVGAGTGLLAEQVLARFPAAEVTLLDFSAEMLDRARARFAGRPARVTFRTGDYLRDPLGGPWDAIVSALSVHHLSDGDKRALYARAAEALAPGGILVNADNVLAEDPAVAARDRALWIRAIRASGLAEADLEAALERTRVDVLAPLGLQLGWLRALGLAEVDCAYKWHHFAVFSGRRPVTDG